MFLGEVTSSGRSPSTIIGISGIQSAIVSLCVTQQGVAVVGCSKPDGALRCYQKALLDMHTRRHTAEEG